MGAWVGPAAGLADWVRAAALAGAGGDRLHGIGWTARRPPPPFSPPSRPPPPRHLHLALRTLARRPLPRLALARPVLRSRRRPGTNAA